MSGYKKPNPELWTGRKSDRQLYLHEKIKCIPFDRGFEVKGERTFALLGYSCDEGVKRNHGRVGALEGPDAIRRQLAKLPNHLDTETQLLDVGSIQCLDRDLETAQNSLSEKVVQLLENNVVPILLGGGHDIAYGHYSGIKKFLGGRKTMGIINFDAHFDLRSNEKGNNSGTPFYQIAQDCKADDSAFNYLCLGIRRDANDRTLFATARELDVSYIENDGFTVHRLDEIQKRIDQFMHEVDCLYMTIDLDGFSSAYAPGVSAPSPMGFSPDIVLKCLDLIINSKKIISMDIAEMNPTYDLDDQTAKLAASLVHFMMHRSSNNPFGG